jgi:acyl-CoA reductase-like NAD-dependent aldehyde dehydrogenase
MSVQATRVIERIACFEPATRARLGEVDVDTPDDVRAAVEASRRAQESWSKTSFATRRRVLQRILDHLLAHADELVDLVVRDSGKTYEHAILGEIWPVCEKLRWTIANGEKHLLPEKVSSGMLMHKRARIEFPPLGVIGVITPWNYPLQNVLGPAIPALMAGNGVVCKVSEQVAWSSTRIQGIFDEALIAEGISPQLVRLVNGYGQTGAALVSSGVDAVVFTGSVPNGRKVLAGSAETLTPVILELGGKDAMIVCEDADLDQAVHSALAGVYINAGQNCLSAERILVHESVADAFEARIIEAVSQFRCGPPTRDGNVDVGAIISPFQLDVIDDLVQRAVGEGAVAAVGGKRILEDVGQFYAPTVLTGLRPDMAIMQEETFGPVMSICRVSSDEEALEVANGTNFGLSSTVFTKSRKRAAWYADKLVAGSTLINDFGLTYMVQDLPFGGVRASGFGRLNGREGLRACCNIKAIVDDRVPLHQPTKVFPVGASDYETYRGAIRALYGQGLSAKARGATEILSTLRGRS